VRGSSCRRCTRVLLGGRVLHWVATMRLAGVHGICCALVRHSRTDHLLAVSRVTRSSTWTRAGIWDWDLSQLAILRRGSLSITYSVQ